MLRSFWMLLAVLAIGSTPLQAARAGAQATSEASASSAAAPSDVIAAYRLGPGDKVRILTFGEAALTGDFVISSTGVVALPLIGDVQAKGLSVSEFQAAVEGALRQGYLREPRVSVEVLNYRPFYILGEVTKPGEYPYTNGLTVMNAVATANGFTYRADTKHVFIRRANEKAEHKLDLTTLSAVAPGDTIRIGERYF